MQQSASRLRSIDAAAKRSKSRTGIGHDLQARPRLEQAKLRVIADRTLLPTLGGTVSRGNAKRTAATGRVQFRRWPVENSSPPTTLLSQAGANL
jgi:hypothetical protein